jgi:3-methylcrotonyl-CoA carboxylase alpha subunit
MALPVVLRHGNRDYQIVVHESGRVTVDGQELRAVQLADQSVRFDDSGAAAWAVADGSRRWVFLEGRTYIFEMPSRRQARTRGSHHESLTAPMPATVRRINVAVGDRVTRGDTLIVLEAMKMELPVKAGTDGIVEAINCRESELVQPGTTLIELGAGDEETT